MSFFYNWFKFSGWDEPRLQEIEVLATHNYICVGESIKQF